MNTRPRGLVLVVMGVSGSGKSTVAELVAGRLGWVVAEGDAMHPRANVEKMAAGRPLDDADRWPWLAAVRAWIRGQLEAGEPGVVTCSALRRSYRDALRGETVAGSGLAADPALAARAREGAVMFVHLHGAPEVLAGRLAGRRGHFMPAGLLASQLAALEEPGPDERALTVDIGPAPAAVAQTIVDRLGLAAAGS
ncbi:gluconokinase [Frankia sp. CNm7]|uniref:Gluconokinase n=1 Tax=Frankia nepalensis TaxID=1836974 RepID=A0A937RE81_9ACTN|nr:gluconokinase [Frankia nepalensis]MBL7501274.1 gluconokinase [Frankia nepalensis]MBL7510121.1 gluconokinase [Frankia nepalensis]MBL7523860.1 gluconokinase [Frankia nepalensis]MBL7627355.1 gluconokinase [Frankia nepalensis]